MQTSNLLFDKIVGSSIKRDDILINDYEKQIKRSSSVRKNQLHSRNYLEHKDSEKLIEYLNRRYEESKNTKSNSVIREPQAKEALNKTKIKSVRKNNMKTNKQVNPLKYTINDYSDGKSSNRVYRQRQKTRYPSEYKPKTELRGHSVTKFPNEIEELIFKSKQNRKGTRK